MSGSDLTLREWCEESGAEAVLGSCAVGLVATVLGNEVLTRRAHATALALGAEPALLGEVARMAHLFGGFPRAIQGLNALEAALADHGAVLPAEEAEKGRDRDADRARGRALFDTIYGEHSARVLGGLDRVLPDYSQWILEHAYGRVLGRPGLGALERELLAVAVLYATDCPAQCTSHVRGARRLGASEAQLRAVVELVRRAFPGEASRSRAEIVPPARS